MKTLLNNVQWIEKYLDGTLGPVNRLVFETRLLVNPELRKDLYFQKKTYSLVKMYHRKKFREELETIHRQIFSDRSKIGFQQKILNLFNP